MLKNTKNIRKKYEEIERKLFYMIPEKWDEVYLYASVIERLGSLQTGELFFYYIPKGIIKRKPINVYEIPAKFNIDEDEYMKLVQILYRNIKELREEFKKSNHKVWSNLTIIIKKSKFKIVYNYENLENSLYSNYEKHVIWRYKYLKQGIECCNKEERRILHKYLDGPKMINSDEVYEEGVYIKNIKNIVDYETAGYESIQNVEYISSRDEKSARNQILDWEFGTEQISHHSQSKK